MCLRQKSLPHHKLAKERKVSNESSNLGVNLELGLSAFQQTKFHANFCVGTTFPQQITYFYSKHITLFFWKEKPMKKKCPGRRPKGPFPRANLQANSSAFLNETEQRKENVRPPSNSVADFESTHPTTSNPVTTTDIVSEILFMETGEPTPSSSPTVGKKAKKIPQ